MIGWIISIISGILMSVQGVFNTEVTKQSSIWAAAAFVQITALAVCVTAWLATGREGTIKQLFQVTPRYMLLGGVLGAFITFTVIKSVGKLGPAKAIAAIVISQVLAAYLIELFGLFGCEQVRFEWKKLIGVVLMIGGLLVFKLAGGDNG